MASANFEMVPKTIFVVKQDEAVERRSGSSSKVGRPIGFQGFLQKPRSTGQTPGIGTNLVSYESQGLSASCGINQFLISVLGNRYYKEL